MSRLPNGLHAERASGWWALHHIVCDRCGWRSRAIDAICDESEWRRTAYGHRCEEDDQ